MSSLLISRDQFTAGYRPGETVSGTVEWDIDPGPDALEIRLFWYTNGKGTRDVGVAATERIDAPGTSGRRSFRFTLPDAPYSFSGKLISLIWAVETVALPGADAQRVEFMVSPTGTEVLLPEGPAAP